MNDMAAGPSPCARIEVPPPGRPAPRIHVVVPCYRVAGQILGLLARIGPEVQRIFVVDDACPEGTGRLVQAECPDPRVQVLFNTHNIGVGGAVKAGYRRSAEEGSEVVVKLDGDGQMDPAFILLLAAPILTGEADYSKGNRFYDLRHISRMPAMRLAGNAALSFMSKFSTGYWDVFDPTNGYTAIATPLLRSLPMDRISDRYFFESDMLFRLGTLRAVVRDVPMDALYGEEVSNLRIGRALPEFLIKHARNFGKRIFYNYFLRDVSVASIELLCGLLLVAFGSIYGAWNWWQAASTGHPAATGVVMLAAMPVLIGLQLVLAFLSYDIAAVPKHAIGWGLDARKGRSDG